MNNDEGQLLATWLIFCLLSGWIALRDVLFGGPVDENRLAGAICVYLLIGVARSVLYLYLALFDAASFRGLVSEGWAAGSAEFLYLSFVTLTTLGYGDLAPVTPLARTLAYLEAVFGQMDLTVLVAALVGKLLANREG